VSTYASGPGSLVEARGWGWRHAGRRAFAVRELDLRVEPGERVMLLGASGAGKSTLLAGLAGLLGHSDEGESEGSLLLDGIEPGRQRGRAGLVLQDPESHTVLARCGDDVAFGCENLGVPRDEIWRRVDRSLAAVGLPIERDRPTSVLSGGQKQRLALAGVLAMQPGLLLLDEPTANLDPHGVIEVHDAVRAVVEATGATLVVVEHRVDVWADMVNRVVVLAPGGGAAADGSVYTVLSDRGSELAAGGVWVPDHPPPRPARRPDPHRTEAGAARLTIDRLAVARRGAPVAASGLSTTLAAGACTAVTGPNGSGKSTLALTLAGLLAPSDGEVHASDDMRADHRRGPLPTAPIHWRARDLLSRIGTVFQDPEHQFLTGSVEAELRHGPSLAGVSRREVDTRVAELLDRLRLGHLARANPFTLSGGEKRRLSVATALATRPRVLVLDEPTFGQDSRTWAELVALLASLLERGTAVLAATHDADVVDALADTVLELPDGERAHEVAP
jgi:energy-coupling factor transport system ATP-binding protein